MDTRILEELERIRAALLESTTTTRQYDQLYSAQQALYWAINPQMARSPYEVVMLEPVKAIGPSWDTPHSEVVR